MKVIDRTVASNSPQELAIRFLLRHAQCQKTLTARIEGALFTLAADEPLRNKPRMPKEAGRVGEFKADDAARAAASHGTDSQDSFLARFSQAYAAARHSQAPKKALGARSPRADSSSAFLLNGAASAAA